MGNESEGETNSENANTTTAHSRAHTPTAQLILIGCGTFDHCDISAEVGLFNKKLKFKVSVSHRSGAVAALEGPKDVTEHVIRFVCDVLETWGFWVVAVVRTRQFKTIPRNTPRCSQGSVRKIAAHQITASDLNTFSNTFLINMRMKFVMTAT